MDAIAHAKRLLADRRPFHTLPQGLYVDDAVYALDIKYIFQKHWLFAGHTCELRKPGDFITARAGYAEAVILRTADGAIRAYHNACRHRGMRICQVEAGNTARLTCPYHQWTYDLAGNLIFAREMGEDFDPADYALRPVRCETVAGFIYISFADEPMDFGPMRALLQQYLTPHNLENAKIAHVSSIVERGNWKLVWENNRECYHCIGVHPELCVAYDDDPAITGVSPAGGEPGRLTAHWAKGEAIGAPGAFRMADDGRYRVSRVPLARDAASYTMDGKPAVSRPLAELPPGDLGALVLFHYPNTWNHFLRDHAVTFQVIPISPMETMVRTKWLVHADAEEGRDYDLERLTKVWMATNEQDRRLVDESQIGVLSPAYEPGPLSAVHEDGVSQFGDWYTEVMNRALDADAAPFAKAG